MPNLLVCVVHGRQFALGFGVSEQLTYYRGIMAVDLTVDEFCDPDTGILERPISAEPMDVPDFIELDGDRLIFSWWGDRDSIEHGSAKPGAKMLESFMKLADGPDSRILAFARKWGPLHLCAEHGWPLGHLARKDDGPRCLRADVPERGAEEWYAEPLDRWRQLSAMALGLVHVAAALRDGDPGTAEDWERVEAGIGFKLPLPIPRWPEGARWDTVEWQRTLLPHVADHLFTEIGHVGLEIHWDWDISNLGLKLGGRHLFAALMKELVFAMTGTAGFVNCAGCGAPFAPKRQPTAGIRHYCKDCGRAAANRAAQARFRANHKGYFSRHKRKPAKITELVSWTVRVAIHQLADSELDELPEVEQNAMSHAIDKLEALGPSLPFPHQSAVKGATDLRELRPRSGRSRWRAFYRRIGDTMWIGSVGPEAGVNPQGFRRAVAAAQERLAGLGAEALDEEQS